MKTSFLLSAALVGLAFPAAAVDSTSTALMDVGGSCIEEATNALAMVRKAFEPFPGDLLKSEVVRNDDGSPMVDVGEDGSVKVKVRIAVQPSLYREWTKDLMQKLDAVSTTYEDETLTCTLINPAASMGIAAMPDMGSGLPPEYAAMAAQAAQMGGGMGMGYAAAMPVNPLMQTELEQGAGDGAPPLLMLRQDELGGPASTDKGRLTLRVVRPGQDAVWKGNPGDVNLRARVYTFIDGQADEMAAFKADLIRRFIHEAMKLSSEADRGTAAQKQLTLQHAKRSGGSIALSVSILSGKDVLARKDLRPTNHQSQEGEMTYPLSVSAVSLSGMWGAANDIVISPFLILDSAHCYQAWEDWVPVGVLSDADLERGTDIRSEVSFQQ